MSVRYPPLARRKQVAKARDRQMKSDVAEAVGFARGAIPVVERDAPPWPPKRSPGRVEVFDLDTWAHPGKGLAPVGPFLVLCGICAQHPGHFDTADDAQSAQRGHYSKHYEAGETS